MYIFCCVPEGALRESVHPHDRKRLSHQCGIFVCRECQRELGMRHLP